MHTRANTPTLHYITERFAKEPEGFAAIRAEGERLRPGMQVSPYEGRLLAWLVAISGAKRVLEIGSFVGYSTSWLHSALPEDGALITLEADAAHAEITRTHVAAHTNVTLVQGDALAFLQGYTGAPFDLIFIDAEKKSYMNYLDAALPHLTPQAWVVADNTLLWGTLAGEPDAAGASAESQRVMEAFNRRIASEEFEGILLPTIEGLTVGRRK